MENAGAVSGDIVRCCFILHSSLFLHDPVEPEGVAPSPRRSKSPVPVCCGFGSAKVVLAAGFAPALATFSTSCLCWLGCASNGGMPWTCTTLPGFRGAHCLADRPGALVRLTFLETGPRGRSCTCNLPVLSGTPLAGWANAAKWHSRQDSHLHRRRSKRRTLVIELRERKGSRAEPEGRGTRVAPSRRVLSAILPSDFFPSKLEPAGSLALPWGMMPGSLSRGCGGMLDPLNSL